MKTMHTLSAVTFNLLLITAFILCNVTSLRAQHQIEIVLVGAAHHNPNQPETYRPVIDKLKRYNPDMLVTEYMSSDELKEALQLGFWGTKSYAAITDYLTSRNPKAGAKTIGNIPKAYTALGKFAYYHKTRTDLARDLYLNNDRGNAEYQLYILEQHMKQKFGKSELAYFDKVLGPIDSLRKVKLYRPNSEYSKVFFPLAYELKHEKVYAMDSQKFDGPWSQAWAKADSLIKIMYSSAKADAASPAGLAVKAINAYYKQAEQLAGKADLSSYEFLNTALYGEVDAAMNFYGGARFFNEAGYPKEAIQEMLYWWGKRNQAMCDNTIRAAKAKGASRVVVAVGASHRKIMADLFAQMPDVKVINYNELP